MYGKIVVIADRATHHFKSLKVKNFIKKLKDKIILWPLPKRLPELNPMEPGWKSARKNVTYKLFDSKKTLGWAVKRHIRWSLRSIWLNFGVNYYRSPEVAIQCTIAI
jgi:transposase